MADLLKKISDLTAGTPANTDIIPYVDLATNTTKKALKSELKGEKGDTGTAATVDVGTTTTVATTVPAAVTNSGTTSAAIFDFVIPKGETGNTGPAGADGLSCVWKGAWLTSTSYILQEIVSYGGSSYVCIEAHTSGTFATDLAAGKWELACEAGLDITWKGAYDNGTAYVVNDAVSYNGSSYICIASTTGNLPTNGTYWNLMAQKGTDGAGSGDVLGPATNTDSYIPQWDGVNSKTLKNGLGLDTDLTSVSASDDTVPSAKATKAMGDLKLPLAGGTMTGNLLFTDNSYDIGASGATRPRTLYLGTGATIPALTATTVNKVTITSPASSATLTIADGKTLAANNSLTLAGTDSTIITFQGTDTYVGRATTDTLTNKRITKRTGSTTSSATPTINTDNIDMYLLTAQAVDITSFTTNLSGTPTEGQTLWISITGTAARAITWGTSFEASTVALPTTTVTTARLDVGFVWNATTSKWRCVASA